MGGNGGILFFGVLLKKKFNCDEDEELLNKFYEKTNPIHTFNPYDGGEPGGLYLMITESFKTQEDGPIQIPTDNTAYLKQLMEFTLTNRMKIDPTKIGWWFMAHEIY